MGLLGSTHYVEKLFSSRKHILMLNLIWLDEWKITNSIFGLGSSPVLSNVIDSISSIENIGIVKLQDGFGPSDTHLSTKRKFPLCTSLPVHTVITTNPQILGKN
jgi:hypothetical protein